MNSKFVTPAILSSALTLSALSFIACGDDSNPVIQPQPGVSSSSIYTEPEDTPITSIVFTGLEATAGTGKMFFKGSITIDVGDENTVADVDAVHFTDVKFVIRNSVTHATQGEVTITNPILDYASLANPVVSLNEMGVQTDLEKGYTECGSFELVITAFATDGEISSNTTKTIPFVRSEDFCKEPEESSSSAAPEIKSAPLKHFTIEMDTKVAKCVNIATESKSDEGGDLCFNPNASKNGLDLSSTTGLQFALYTNKNDNDEWNDYSFNLLPEELNERVAYTSDFLYNSGALKDTFANVIHAQNIANTANSFIVGVTSAYNPSSEVATGFYAFAVMTTNIYDANGNSSFTLVIYKAQ